MLIESAKLAPYWNPQLEALHEQELTLGNPNRATLSVARKLVEYMLAVERQGHVSDEPYLYAHSRREDQMAVCENLVCRIPGCLRRHLRPDTANGCMVT